jgi:imidazolonepropionase-like amidohydrolase
LVFALRAARVFDGERLLARPTMLIDATSIVAAGVSVPETVATVELGDVLLMPGLVDCHQHLCFDGQGSLEDQVTDVDDDALGVRARASARRALRRGVTTLRDLGDRGYVTLGLRDEESLPTIVASGPPITRVDGHCWFLGGTCTSQDELRRAVAERAERACDLVKVMVTGGYGTPGFAMWEPQFGAEEVRIVVDKAHQRGLPVAAHCHGNEGIGRALDAGVDTVEHCSFYSNTGRPAPDETLLARLAASGVGISLTLGRLPDHPLPANLAENRPTMFGAWGRLHQLGAPLVAGSDAGITDAKPHDVLPYAFGDLLDIGMTPLEALRSLTTVAARVCGVGDRKGRLAPGFDADLVALSADPFHDPTALNTIRAVWLAGSRAH